MTNSKDNELIVGLAKKLGIVQEWEDGDIRFTKAFLDSVEATHESLQPKVPDNFMAEFLLLPPEEQEKVMEGLKPRVSWVQEGDPEMDVVVIQYLKELKDYGICAGLRSMDV